MRIPIIVATAALLLMGTASPAAEIEYFPLSHPYALSGDGSTVVGYDQTSGSSDTFAVRRTRGSGAVSLGLGHAWGVSYDGSAVVGDIHQEAFRWTDDTDIEFLGVPPNHDSSAAAGVSADGSVVTVVASTLGIPGGESFRWTEADGMQRLAVPPGYNSARLFPMSADGSFIVGTVELRTPTDISAARAVRWTEDAGIAELGNLPGKSRSLGSSISADGSVIVGLSSTPGVSVEVFRWTEQTGMVGLGITTGGSPSISPDGVVVLSESAPLAMWDEVNGVRSLREVLLQEHDLELPATTFITGLSADRRALAGSVFESGTRRAFLITLDTPLGPPILHGDYNKNGLVEQQDLDLVLTNWGEPASTAIPGWRYDFPAGLVDQTELDAVLAGWGNTKEALTANVTSAVPEPGTAVLLIIGAMAIAALHRRRQKPQQRWR